MADMTKSGARFIPDAYLLGRDDSGGLNYQPYNAQFADGGFTTGSKAHLGGTGPDNPIVGDEQLSTQEARDKNRGVRDQAPASSKKDARD